jgi:hypothetical protein
MEAVAEKPEQPRKLIWLVDSLRSANRLSADGS